MLTMISAFLICTGGLCQHRSTIGVDMGRIISTSGMNISAGFEITEHWSASWKSEMDFYHLHRNENQEYLEHLAEIDEVTTKERVFQNSSITCQYWVTRTFKGAFLETGIMEKKNIKAVPILGVGYFMPAWKGICGCISYRCGSGLSFGIYLTI